MKNFSINLILSLILMELGLFFFQKILKAQFSKKNYLLYIPLHISCFILGNLLGNCLYSYCLITFCTFLFLHNGLKFPILKIISYFSILSILTLNIQFFTFNILSSSSYFEMIDLPLTTILLIFSLSAIGLLIYFILQHFTLDPLFIHAIYEKSRLIIGLSTINLGVVYAILLTSFELLAQHILYLLMLDIYFYFSLDFVIHSCYWNYTKQKIVNLKLCNKTILTMYDDTRAFKHDFHNILQAIGGYILTNDMEGLKNYYTQISNDCIISNNLAKLNPELINNPAIYNILADKYNLANNHNIQINLDVMLDLNALHMNIYELTRILGILLDNAIEASKDCHEKNIHIAFKQDTQKQMLIIENTYSNKQVAIDKIFEKNFTTKPHNTGLGLWEVKKILNKNNHLNLHTTKNNEYFSQQLEIYSA